MNLVRFDPFRELETMSSRLNQFLGGTLAASEIDGLGPWAPAMDVEETDKEYLVKTDLPEVKKDNVKVGIEDGVLTIEGERQQEREEKHRKIHRTERLYGKFVRRVSVPSDVDQGHVAAEFRDGVLSVHLPKSPASQPRSIDVKIA